MHIEKQIEKALEWAEYYFGSANYVTAAFEYAMKNRDKLINGSNFVTVVESYGDNDDFQEISNSCIPADRVYNISPQIWSNYQFAYGATIQLILDNDLITDFSFPAIGLGKHFCQIVMHKNGSEVVVECDGYESDTLWGESLSIDDRKYQIPVEVLETI